MTMCFVCFLVFYFVTFFFVGQSADGVVSSARPLSRLDASPLPLLEELRYGLWGVVLWLSSALGIIAGVYRQPRLSALYRCSPRALELMVLFSMGCQVNEWTDWLTKWAVNNTWARRGWGEEERGGGGRAGHLMGKRTASSIKPCASYLCSHGCCCCCGCYCCCCFYFCCCCFFFCRFCFCYCCCQCRLVVIGVVVIVAVEFCPSKRPIAWRVRGGQGVP